MEFHAFCRGTRSTMRQMNESREPNSSLIASTPRAFLTAASILSRFRTIPESPSRPSDIGLGIGCDLLDVEPVERYPVARPFPEDRSPAQAGLRAFEDQHLEEVPLIMGRDAPLFIVVRDIQRITAAPLTSDFSVIHRLPRIRAPASSFFCTGPATRGIMAEQRPAVKHFPLRRSGSARNRRTRRSFPIRARRKSSGHGSKTPCRSAIGLPPQAQAIA